MLDDPEQHKRRSRAKIAFKVSFTTEQKKILKMHQLLHIFHVYVPSRTRM